jgi:hypothetical protein
MQRRELTILSDESLRVVERFARTDADTLVRAPRRGTRGGRPLTEGESR